MIFTRPSCSISEPIFAHKLYRFLQDRLEWLELSDNGNITEKGLRHLRKLRKLKFLKLGNLQGVQNPSDILELLKKDMPDCEIIYDDKL